MTPQEELAEARKEIAALRAQLDGVAEFEVRVREGRLDGKIRARFVRTFAGALAAVMIADGGPNFYEIEVHPEGPHVPEHVGTLVLTIQNKCGKTPTQILAGTDRFWDARLRRVQTREVHAGAEYLVLVHRSRFEAARLASPWLRMDGRSLRGTLDGNVSFAREIYELSEPEYAAWKRMPAAGRRYVARRETQVLTSGAIPVRVELDTPLEAFGEVREVAKGAVFALRRGEGAEAGLWLVVADEGRGETLLRFPFGQLVPDWLDRLPEDGEPSCDCCPRAGVYNGYGSDGPLLFACPADCACHD